MMTISLEKFNLTMPTHQRSDATWQDYVAVRDSPNLDWRKIAFNQGWLWVDMGTEGPNHASFSDLMTMIFGFWAFLHPDIPLQSYSRCLIEKPETQACAPDLVLYKGEDIPRLQSGESRRIQLDHFFSSKRIEDNTHSLSNLIGIILRRYDDT